MTSIVLGQYDSGGLLRYMGHVTLGVSGKYFARVRAHPRVQSPPFSPIPKGNENAVWIKPDLLCTVSFMERTESGSMRQPVFKGLREDKQPMECKIIEQRQGPHESMWTLPFYMYKTKLVALIAAVTFWGVMLLN